MEVNCMNSDNYRNCGDSRNSNWILIMFILITLSNIKKLHAVNKTPVLMAFSRYSIYLFNQSPISITNSSFKQYHFRSSHCQFRVYFCVLVLIIDPLLEHFAHTSHKDLLLVITKVLFAVRVAGRFGIGVDPCSTG